MLNNIKEDLELFNSIVQDLLKDEDQNPVSKPIKPEDIGFNLDLTLREEPAVNEDFKAELRKLVLSTPKTATNKFFNQLFGGRNSKAVLGDLLAVMLNNSMYTYKVAGPQVGVEMEIISSICNLVGYDEKAGGTIPTGGSMSNFMAMVMARDAFDPDTRFTGMNTSMVAYTSENSHYSIAKAASFIGMGRDNLRFIPSDSEGKMLSDKLEEQINLDIENGLKPFFVNATTGTTVLGAFDPLLEIHEICKKHNIWLHADGAYCGSVVFSDKYRHLISGIEKCDSFSLNAHKMLNTPLTCSVIVVKNQAHLLNSFDNDADYLYQSEDDIFNPGRTSFQCGRRNDSLKFWTLWKSFGTKGLSNMVEKQFELADIAREYVRNNSNYTLYSFNDSISICFNYKGLDAAALCNALNQDQQTMVGFGAFQDDKFIRLITINPNNSADDILEFFKTLESYVEKNEEFLPKINSPRSAE
jgi:sulfinoalanine decarboxylase